MNPDIDPPKVEITDGEGKKMKELMEMEREERKKIIKATKDYLENTVGKPARAQVKDKDANENRDKPQKIAENWGLEDYPTVKITKENHDDYGELGKIIETDENEQTFCIQILSRPVHTISLKAWEFIPADIS